MYGVVLWSDTRQNKAVIWCEDHRNLAFFKQEADAQEAAQFAPGDLVEFDLREENELRLAVDPCLVAPHEFPSLAADLKSACEGLQREPVSMPGRDTGVSGAGGRDTRVVVLRPKAAPRKAANGLAVLSCG